MVVIAVAQGADAEDERGTGWRVRQDERCPTPALQPRSRVGAKESVGLARHDEHAEIPAPGAVSLDR